MNSAAKTLPCGHPESDETSADGYTFCAVCAVSDPLTEEGGVNESSSGVHGQQMSPLRSPEIDRSGRSFASTSPPAASGSPCPRCDGDGYVECWNKDHSDVVITLCTDCGPGSGYVDG